MIFGLTLVLVLFVMTPFIKHYFNIAEKPILVEALPKIEGEMTFSDSYKLTSTSLEHAYQTLLKQYVTTETAAFLRKNLPIQNTEDHFDDETYLAVDYRYIDATSVVITVFWHGGQDVHKIKLVDNQAKLTITNYVD